MALAVICCGFLRFLLPNQLRDHDARWIFLALLVILVLVLVVGDPGRIDQQKPWLRVVTDFMIAIITLVNVSAAIRLVEAIINTREFTSDAKSLLASGFAIWLTNVLAFALWYWDLDRGGAAARVRGTGPSPAFVFPEMLNPQFVPENWTPRFVDYFHLSFSTATAFSPTDVSAIKSWAKSVMMMEEGVSLVVAVFVIARAVNILQ
jgi:hypothetical protein